MEKAPRKGCFLFDDCETGNGDQFTSMGRKRLLICINALATVIDLHRCAGNGHRFASILRQRSSICIDVPAMVIDLHRYSDNRNRFAFSFFFEKKENRRSHQFLNWWQQVSTGHLHFNRFDSVSLTHKKRETLLRVSLFLVPATGIEPVRILLRGILSPLCLPIPPCRHRFVIVA